MLGEGESRDVGRRVWAIYIKLRVLGRVLLGGRTISEIRNSSEMRISEMRNIIGSGLGFGD